MARRSRRDGNPAQLLSELRGLLNEFEGQLEDPELRTRVRNLIPAFRKLRDLGCSLMSEDTRNGRERVLLYLRKYQGTIVDGEELMVIAGIGEWARRLRELRVQEGWVIYSGATIKAMSQDDPAVLSDIAEQFKIDPLKLKPDQYVLAAAEQDRDAAHRWHVLNKIRKKKISVIDKLLEYFLANIGKSVTGEELNYLANDKSEWPRRTRELRTEEGWAIATKQSGRPELPVGVYVLEHERQARPHDRHIKDPVRVEVLTRDNFSCTKCGWKRSDANIDDPRRYLELHHIIHHKDKGTNTPENLITLCNVHHDEVHRSIGKTD